jgi:hypothetical protein
MATFKAPNWVPGISPQDWTSDVARLTLGAGFEQVLEEHRVRIPA